MLKKVLSLITMVLLAGICRAQQDTTALPDSADLSNMSIEELSKMRSKYAATDMEKVISQAIEAASRKPLSLRKSPSIVSVITEEEIIKSGAKDLMDLLQLIPGMEFNTDVEGIVALSFRGLWANEGNISLQIDGQEVNEIAYASLQFGNHYQVSQIKRIEVIRGPGSAIYGGCAEYAVINIITRKGDDLKGINASAIAGQTAEKYARQKLSLSIGNHKGDLTYSISGLTSRGILSNRTYTDVYGSSYGMPDYSANSNNYLNMSLAYKALSVQFIYDDYKTENRDNSIAIMSRAYPLNFLSCMSQVKYTGKISRKSQFTLKFDHRYSEPWSFRGQPDPVDSEYTHYLLRANTFKGNASILWDPVYWLNVNYGIEAYTDRGRLMDGDVFRTDNTDRVMYFNYAPFTQALFKTNFANITIGARYDVSTAFGSAFNPRLGITKRIGMFNFKMLYARSFRAPAIESIQYGMDNMKLKPEQSETVEFEASAKLGKNMYLSANIYDISTTNAIRYFVKTDSVVIGYPDGYRNSDRIIGSQGFELEYKYKSGWGFINVAYSYYTVKNKNVDEESRVQDQPNVTLGTANNKLTLLGSANVGKKAYLSVSVNYLGTRYGYSTVDSLGNGILTAYMPQTTINLYAGSDKLVKNMSLGLGIANVTDEHIIYPQAYNSLHAPLPGMGREVYVKINYRIPFKQGS